MFHSRALLYVGSLSEGEQRDATRRLEIVVALHVSLAPCLGPGPRPPGERDLREDEAAMARR